VSEPTQTAPEPESVPLPDVLVLPAEYFFIEKVKVPAALSPCRVKRLRRIKHGGRLSLPT